MKANKKIAAILAVQMMASALPMLSQAEVTVDTIVNDSVTGTALSTLGMPATTPSQNVFYVGEKPFILLDQDLDDDDSDYFIYADSIYANRCFYGGQKFYVTHADGGLMGVWMNRYYLSGGDNTLGLPTDFDNYIDKNHTWVTETGHPSGLAPEAYSFTCPVTLLSWTELKEYASKIGYSLADVVYLRTGSLDYADRLLATHSGGTLSTREVALPGNVRPCFWIDKDFFANTALDVDTMGFNVKRTLAKNYTAEELAAAGYTADDIEVIEEANVEAGIYGTTKPGYAVNVVADNSGTYQWYRCESATDAGTAIEGAVGDTYALVNADGGKYVKVTVSVNGEVVETYTTAVDPALNHGWTGGGDLVLPLPNLSPAENVFELKSDSYNQKFILLDEEEDTDASFFINTYDLVAKNAIWGGGNRWNPNLISGELAPTLAGAYYQGTWGNEGKTLPQDLAAYIDADHVWLTEAGVPTDSYCPNDFTFVAPVTLLSLTELIQYQTKIGYHAGDYIWLRTPSPVNSGYYMGYKKWGGVNHAGSGDTDYGVRPCFWLGEDVFKNVALDLDATGDNVKEILRTRYTKEELAKAGYTGSELFELFDTETRIDGTLKPGYTVKAKHNKSGAYQWYRSDVEGTLGTAIEGATAESYTLVNADGGKYVSFTVTADGAVVETVTAKIDNALVNDWVGDQNYEIGAPKAENLFVVESDTGAQQFVYIDSAEDEASSFFVTTADCVAGACFYGNQFFNVNSQDGGLLSMILNNQYLAGTFGNEGKTLPADVAAYIDRNHQWLTEAGYVTADGGHAGTPNDYVITAGVTLLSLNEIKQYGSIVGKTSNHYTYLRTGSKMDPGHMLKTDTYGYVGQTPIANVGGVRPCFWLGNDFFKNVRLDLLNTGDAVKKMLRTRYTRTELSAIYDDAELTILGYDETPLNVYNFVYTDADSNEIDDVRYAGDTLKVSATLASYASDSKASVITAVYNDKGDMIKVDLKNFTLTKGVETPVDFTIDLSDVEIGKGYTAATYFWTGLSEMVPISDSFEI